MGQNVPISGQAGVPTLPDEHVRRAREASAWLQAVVENSDDAILSKTLDGIITTWNRGAERLFGFTAEEAVGQHITIVIPQDRRAEEEDILRRLRSGERVDHFETVRRRKDGELVEVSLTVSPVRNEAGEILGASKIARDITEQKRARAQQAILLREMNHRVKNLFSLAAGLLSLSARKSETVEQLASDLGARLHALARAHDLILPDHNREVTTAPRTTTFSALVQSILAPHRQEDDPRIVVTGADAALAGDALTSIALLLHELTTNAVKYGALSVPDGRLSVRLAVEGGELRVFWEETNAPPSDAASRRQGFGTTLEQAALRGIGGTISRDWRDGGVSIALAIPLDRLVH
ncbi:PAS domain S-box protein [Shinella pollutisoli]|uniref:Blue-light-activated histidine kinase n=1 Tax=Shinella pollutisoli TaxID=2250594 RepID=A0ABV7DL25_9HYPH|nr:PAS domain S-box protein [Shinella pollutisoli]